MIEIVQPTLSQAQELADLAKTTFIQSHGHSASEADILNYVNLNFTLESFQKELSDQDNIYHILSSSNRIVGYSKINLNIEIPNIQPKSIAKLSRIYLLNEVHGTGLGRDLFNFNVEFTKLKNQAGIWLYVWVDNERAVAFYEKMGFEIVGEHDFEISKTHSNPNHQMFLKF